MDHKKKIALKVGIVLTIAAVKMSEFLGYTIVKKIQPAHISIK